MSRIGIVVVRFGPGVTGGAEMHAQLVATRLAGRGHDVTILTTCAEDYVTWADTLPAGEAADGPVRVIRFPVRRQRDLQRWEKAMQPFLARCWDADNEETLLREQGPDCPALLDHLRHQGSSYDAVIFFTLLYAPTVFGIPLVWDRAILVPTLHDEISAHLDLQARAIRLARRVLWNTPEERALAERIYDLCGVRGDVAGVGVETPGGTAEEADRTRARFGLGRPYLLYAGRIDPEKGCGELFDYFREWAERDGRADLVLAGHAWMEVPDHPRIHRLGFVESEEVWALMAGALATAVPSRNESLSLAALESLSCGTPILVTADSRVLIGHALRGNAGFVYRTCGDFGAALTQLLDDAALRARMGEAGRGYVAANFTWDRIMRLYDDAIAAMAVRRAA